MFLFVLLSLWSRSEYPGIRNASELRTELDPQPFFETRSICVGHKCFVGCTDCKREWYDLDEIGLNSKLERRLSALERQSVFLLTPLDADKRCHDKLDIRDAAIVTLKKRLQKSEDDVKYYKAVVRSILRTSKKAIDGIVDWDEILFVGDGILAKDALSV
jgi:hypothetical protein